MRKKLIIFLSKGWFIGYITLVMSSTTTSNATSWVFFFVAMVLSAVFMLPLAPLRVDALQECLLGRRIFVAYMVFRKLSRVSMETRLCWLVIATWIEIIRNEFEFFVSEFRINSETIFVEGRLCTGWKKLFVFLLLKILIFRKSTLFYFFFIRCFKIYFFFCFL